MKVHIENLNIHLGSPSKFPPGLIATLALAGAAAMPEKAEPKNVPQVGEKWPGLDATYAGKAMSKDGDKLVHLIAWNAKPDKKLDYKDANEWANKVNPEMDSHAPTRMQSITLFNNLQDEFNKDDWYWTMEKTKSGECAFVQIFGNGYQFTSYLYGTCRVRAVSEIQL